MNTYDVVTVGSATLDVLLCCINLYTAEVNGEKKMFLPYGQKIELDKAEFVTGGGATNTATTFARSELKTAAIAKIGKDFAGERVATFLEQETIDPTLLVYSHTDQTDFATIIWAPLVGNIIIVCRGKDKLEVNEVDWEQIQTKWFYISSIEGNLNILETLIKNSKNHPDYGTKIAWNPGKRELSQKNDVISILPSIEILILNRQEASLFTGKDPQDMKQILTALSTLPTRQKLITDGHNGSYYHNGTNWIFSGAFSVEKQEATGAGDAYGSAFVAGKIKGLSDEVCLKRAAANAASVVMYPGTKKGILKEDDYYAWVTKPLDIKTLGDEKL